MTTGIFSLNFDFDVNIQKYAKLRPVTPKVRQIVVASKNVRADGMARFPPNQYCCSSKNFKSRLFKVGIILLRFDFFDICSSDHKADHGGVQFHEPAVKTLNLRSN